MTHPMSNVPHAGTQLHVELFNREMNAPREPVDASCKTELQRRIASLRAALRRERQLGRAGNAAYDLTRHMMLTRRLREATENF